jgi:hypothetical protein
MMRFSSLFLVVNILLCYSGIPLGAFASSETTSTKTVMGCHSNGPIAKETGEKSAARGIHGSSEKISSCCLDGLTNASIDQPAKIEKILVQRITVSNLYYQTGCMNKKLDLSQREHDPPDLQITYSVFLL